MEKFSLSIIIPAYNEAKYISILLDSIVKQNTQYNFETIVVDNNSTDDTAKIVNKYPVKLVSQPLQGAANAKNKGVEVAKAEWMLFVDADCKLPQDYVDTVMSCIKDANTDTVGIAGSYYYYDAPWFTKTLTGKLHPYKTWFAIAKIIFGYQLFLGGNFVANKKIFKNSSFDRSKSSASNYDSEDYAYAKELHKLGHTIRFDKRMKIMTSYRRPASHSFGYSLKRFIDAMKMLLSKSSVK